ncbi:class I SAM-dependent methyltransferase [Morganella morganii]|uniref:class I SAM-dependent methyltransferase n=1 Tax=Morganella morganii TaxID=582 RepID=UPI000D1DCBFC|nr:class I SAM-dependent methyltransferase [Morganella morganii]HAE78333.1 SAM-dependent methyltransferase [Morganella sp. (in: enterobacteria)]QXO43465.1 class I SAM-dependent methyltransferase [Morganella morganii]QXO47057.1 class I SAM-dependent methyltransferase [Morganella morganii]QXO50826.1 class I SAM-dependent methyltransferase [Morganella morganii]QXO54692.1 class I SAM-dependent methyltransferase [Morganella morganii]
MFSARATKTLIMPDSWDDIPCGRGFLQSLEAQLAPWWPKMFGFHLIKVGTLSGEIDSSSCMIPHQVNVARQGNSLQVAGEAAQLPFQDKSADVCVLAHNLGYSSDPHRVLREADRILIEDGWLIISGFNPLSLLGARKLIPWRLNQHPQYSRMFSQLRIIDWLSLLNYEIMYHRLTVPIPWCDPESFGNRYAQLLGCLGVIIARKRTVSLTFPPQKLRLLRPKLSNVVGATRQQSPPRCLKRR